MSLITRLWCNHPLWEIIIDGNRNTIFKCTKCNLWRDMEITNRHVLLTHKTESEKNESKN